MALRAVPEHPKFARLKLTLKIGKGEALGYLECMWHFCGKFTPQGNIGKYAPEEIEAWCEWPGEEGAMIAAMLKAGWLKLHPAHGIVVNDWHLHADDATKLALKRSKKPFVTYRDGDVWLDSKPVEEGDAESTPSPKSEPCHDSVPTVSGLPEPEPVPEPVFIQPTAEEIRGASARVDSAGEAEPMTDEELAESVARLGRKPVESEGALYWHVASEPLRSVALALTWGYGLLGQTAPIAEKATRFVGDTQKCRKVVDQLGWRRAGSAYAFGIRKGKITSWSGLWDNLESILFLMDNGTEWVERKPARMTTRKSTLDEQTLSVQKEIARRAMERGEMSKEDYARVA